MWHTRDYFDSTDKDVENIFQNATLMIPEKARRDELANMTNLMFVAAISQGKIRAPGTKNTGVHRDNMLTLCQNCNILTIRNTRNTQHSIEENMWTISLIN